MKPNRSKRTGRFLQGRLKTHRKISTTLALVISRGLTAASDADTYSNRDPNPNSHAYLDTQANADCQAERNAQA
jgi:hypothetical protein